MSKQATAPVTRATPDRRPTTAPLPAESPSTISGWVFFGAVMMITAGVLWGVMGLTAVLNDTWVVFGQDGALVFDITVWGWIHLGLGIAAVLSGAFLFTGNPLARILTIVLAAAAIVANFLWLPVYPLWSIAVMITAVLVIYGVAVHGREAHRVL